MARNRISFLIIIAFTFLILVSFQDWGYSQQQSESVLNTETQEPAKEHKLIKRPPRYPSALAGLEVLADLTVTPLKYTGPCPAVFIFKGKITVNRPTVLQYRFIRSDNTRHSLGVLNFEEAGTQEVTDVWEFDDPTQLPVIKGWEAIQVNFPMKVRSNIAYIMGTCTDYKGGPPTPESLKNQDASPETAPGTLTWPQEDPLLPPIKR